MMNDMEARYSMCAPAKSSSWKLRRISSEFYESQFESIDMSNNKKKCFLIFAPLWVSVSEADRRKNVNYRPKIKCTCLNEGDAMCRWGKEDTVVMHNVCTVPSDCSKRLHRVSS